MLARANQPTNEDIVEQHESELRGTDEGDDNQCVYYNLTSGGRDLLFYQHGG